MSSSIPVRIELRSIWDGEQTEHRYIGELYHKGAAIYVRYSELDDEGAGETRTLVKLTEQEIKVTRRGQVESEQLYVLHEQRRGFYRTDLGTLPVVTHTSELSLQRMDGVYTAAWTYSLHIAEESAGNFNLKLTIREERL